MHNIDALAEQHKVYAFDFWGLGYSTREPLDYSYDLYVEQLSLFMDVLDIHKASLVGHSMGGGTAIKFSLIHRNKVEKLVLVDATGMPSSIPLRSKVFILPVLGEFCTILQLSKEALEDPDPHLKKLGEQTYLSIRRPLEVDITRGLQQGLFHELDPKTVSTFMIGIMESLYYSQVIDKKPVSAKTWEEMLKYGSSNKQKINNIFLLFILFS